MEGRRSRRRRSRRKRSNVEISRLSTLDSVRPPRTDKTISPGIIMQVESCARHPCLLLRTLLRLPSAAAMTRLALLLKTPPGMRPVRLITPASISRHQEDRMILSLLARPVLHGALSTMCKSASFGKVSHRGHTTVRDSYTC